MTLKLISAQEVLFSGEVTQVTLPGVMGEFMVLQNHASLISTLMAGSVKYVDSAGVSGSAEISGGIVNVDNNVVSVCIY